jgi:hypothetical protein
MLITGQSPDEFFMEKYFHEGNFPAGFVIQWLCPPRHISIRGTRTMQIKPKMLAAIALVCALFIPAVTPQAHAQRHPAYIHALADLRLARAYLDRLTPNEALDVEQQRAIDEIDHAMHDIKQAAMDDGKPLTDHVEIDAHIQRRDRFVKAKEALDAATRDVSYREDDPATRELQQRTIAHLHRAFAYVQTIYLRVH